MIRGAHVLKQWQDPKNFYFLKGKGRGKGCPRRGHDGPEGEQSYRPTLSLTSALDGVGWSTPSPGRITPGNGPVPTVQESGWAPGTVWTGAEKPPPHGFDPQTVQPVAIRYTDYAIQAHLYFLNRNKCNYMKVCNTQQGRATENQRKRDAVIK
jgi:hypothetical protein